MATLDQPQELVRPFEQQELPTAEPEAQKAERTGPGSALPIKSASKPKSKKLAVVLAIFLAFWTWLYTYKVNAAKFWAGLIATIAGIFLLTMFIGLPLLLAIWLWAVFDTVSTPTSWYRQYPNVWTA
jgi:hypothetical protein